MMRASKALEFCLLRTHTARHRASHLYHRLAATTPVLLHLNSQRISDATVPMSTSTKLFKSEQKPDTSSPPTHSHPQPEPPSQPDSTAITITTSHGPTTHWIKRSYPKGKPEKLIQGLERLLSSPSNPNTSTPSSTPQPPLWFLSSHGDAIHRLLTFPTHPQIDKFLHRLSDLSAQLGHDAHIAQTVHPVSRHHVLVATCTTHVPHGLSLKDVKLADGIDGVFNDVVVVGEGLDLSATGTGTGTETGSTDAVDAATAADAEISSADPVVKLLMERNEAAAEEARRNPHSKCAVGANT